MNGKFKISIKTISGQPENWASLVSIKNELGHERAFYQKLDKRGQELKELL